jgi:hypothetical protein
LGNIYGGKGGLFLCHFLFYAISGLFGQVLVAEAVVLDRFIIGGPSQQVGQLAQHVDLFVVDAAKLADRQVEPKLESPHARDVLVSQF